MTSETAQSLIRPLGEGDYGPAMRALPTDRQRAFVLALVNQGSTDFTAAARSAGYGKESVAGLQNIAWRLAHDDRVQAAIQEMARRRLQSAAVVAAQTLLDCLQDPDRRISMKAAQMVLDRVGVHPMTEHKVVVDERKSEAEALRNVHANLIRMGMDAATRQKFLTAAGVRDVEFEELERLSPIEIEHRPATLAIEQGA